MKRTIRKVAVLGSGIMGSRIACHFANAGMQVLLLDRVPEQLSEKEAAQGRSSDDPQVRNRIVTESLQAAVRSNPSPLYTQEALRLIRTGNFEDDLEEIASADWLLEAVVEDLAVKRGLFEKVEQFRRPGSLVTSNTSGIPLHLLAEGRSPDFRACFCGTHFFNPPRYLPLLEIIPTADTGSEVTGFLMHFGDLYLGKTTVRCKDTPAFIANRIGVYSIMQLLHYLQEHPLSVEEVDLYTGPLTGRPKSATFRTTDIVGLDTMIRVAEGLYRSCPEDEEREIFSLPGFVKDMASRGWLGEKTGQGFYKKTKNAGGGSEILSLDTGEMEYSSRSHVRSATVEKAKATESLSGRLRVFASGDDEAARLFRANSYAVFGYCSRRIPEISDELYRIDDAMRAGFGWEMGPFEMWDALGVGRTLEEMEAAGHPAAAWVKEMLAAGCETFYSAGNGMKKYYDIPSRGYLEIPGRETFLFLGPLRSSATVWSNQGVTLTDIGEGILNCEFHTKMNTLGSEVIEGLNKGLDLAGQDFRGLVVANEGSHFSAGANLGLIFMYAVEQEWEEVELMVRVFQDTMMRMRYSPVPVVAAPHNMTLGGACELCLHADHVQAHAELYMGLVEFGAGVIPAGGGTKEFALRASDEALPGGIDDLERLKDRYMTIAMAKVSTSAADACSLGYLAPGRTAVTMNRGRQLAEARRKAVSLAEQGYVQPVRRNNIRVLGKQGLGMFTVGASNMLAGHYISGHDRKISEKLAWVICGGDLSAPAEVSEQYLLDLEREAFLSLCGEKKSLERMQSILTGGKPLRN